MELHQFARSPSDPTWEPPRYRDLHTIDIRFRHNAVPSEGSDEPLGPTLDPTSLNERAEALGGIAAEFSRLCASNAPLEDVKSFLERWADHVSDGRVQANVLAWLNDTNAISSACMHNNIALVRLLLANGLVVRPRAVLQAVAKLRETGNQDIVRLLLQSGWEINQCLAEDTPPVLSMIMEYPDLVSLCLDLGANPNVKSRSGKNTMESAAYFASLRTLETLVQHGAHVEKGALVAQASYAHSEGKPGRLEVAQFLLDRGAPVDAFYLENHTEDSCLAMMFGKQSALHFAIAGGKRDMVVLLLERGADKYIPTCSLLRTDGQTMSPEELARKHGHEDLVALLHQ